MKLYQHYKGELYIVMSSSALVTMVIYYALNEDQGVEPWRTCPFKEFHETVEYEGKRGPCFRFIADAADIMPEGGHP